MSCSTQWHRVDGGRLAWQTPIVPERFSQGSAQIGAPPGCFQLSVNLRRDKVVVLPSHELMKGFLVLLPDLILIPEQTTSTFISTPS